MSDEDWVVPAKLTICFNFCFQIITLFGYCAQFLGNWAQAKLKTFWGKSLMTPNVPASEQERVNPLVTSCVFYFAVVNDTLIVEFNTVATFASPLVPDA